MSKTNEILWNEYHDLGSQDALLELVQNNHGMICTCAKNWQFAYGANTVELEDLYAVGQEAILLAAQTFDPEKEVLFITHATNVINARMQNYMYDNVGLIRLPEKKLRMVNRIKKCRPEGETPDMNVWYETFCDKYDVNVSFEHFSSLVKLGQDFGGYSSLNELLGNDQSIERQDFLGNMESPEEMYIEESMKEEIERCLEILTEREQQIISAYFGLDGKTPKTLKEIARDLGVSISSVGDARNKALWKLKQSTRVENLREYL